MERTKNKNNPLVYVFIRISLHFTLQYINNVLYTVQQVGYTSASTIMDAVQSKV